MAKRKRKVKLSKLEIWGQHLVKWQAHLDKANAVIARAVPQIEYAKKRITQLQKQNIAELVRWTAEYQSELTQAEKAKASNATVQRGSHIDSMPTQHVLDDIPPFLDRAMMDPQERKKEKSRVRIEKLKAKQSGADRRMPLSGKEALAAINESK